MFNEVGCFSCIWEICIVVCECSVSAVNRTTNLIIQYSRLDCEHYKICYWTSELYVCVTICSRITDLDYWHGLPVLDWLLTVVWINSRVDYFAKLVFSRCFAYVRQQTSPTMVFQCAAFSYTSVYKGRAKDKSLARWCWTITDWNSEARRIYCNQAGHCAADILHGCKYLTAFRATESAILCIGKPVLSLDSKSVTASHFADLFTGPLRCISPLVNLMARVKLLIADLPTRSLKLNIDMAVGCWLSARRSV